MKPMNKLPVLASAAFAAFAFSPALLAQMGSTQTGSGYNSTGAHENISDTKGMSKTSGTSGNVSGTDKAFAMKAARDGLAEVELGKLAADKAQNDQVKSLARKMVDDHTKANDELKTIAASKGITLPTATDKSHKAMMSKLQNLSGDAFDKAYVKEMMSDHKRDMKLFDREAKNGKDSDLKSFAQKTQPALEEHHQSLEQVATTIGVAGHRKGSLPAAGRTMSNNPRSSTGTSQQGGGSSNPNPTP